VTLVLTAVVAGALIGLSLGALGGGGSILAVPVLVYALGQSPAQATTGSLVVVGVTSLIGAVTAHRLGNVLLGRGIGFGVVALGGAAVGAKASALVPEPLLLAAFAALMVVVAVLMATRQLRGRRRDGESSAWHRGVQEPILRLRPTVSCECARALKVLLAATAAGLLTGFLGVGGGFLIVPVLTLVLALPIAYAAGTSLVVITMTSAVALGVRVGTGIAPDWSLVLLLTGASVAGAVIGARAAARTDPRRLAAMFSGLVIVVALYTAGRALPALV
jgi:uncharacterized protein